MDNPKLRESIELAAEALGVLAERVGEVVQKIGEVLQVEIPRYKLQELTHPRKKPRGSIRRRRRQHG